MLSSKKPDAPEQRGDAVLHGEHMILVPSPCKPRNINQIHNTPATERQPQNKCLTVSLHSLIENEIAVIIHGDSIRRATFSIIPRIKPESKQSVVYGKSNAKWS